MSILISAWRMVIGFTAYKHSLVEAEAHAIVHYLIALPHSIGGVNWAFLLDQSAMLDFTCSYSESNDLESVNLSNDIEIHSTWFMNIYNHIIPHTHAIRTIL